MIQAVQTKARDAVVLENVAFSFQSRNGAPGKILFERFNLRIEIGSTLVVMGPSGVGKSTLGRLIARSIHVSAGHILYADTIRHSRDISSVDQNPMNTVFPWQTVARNLAYPLRKLGWPRTDREGRVESLMSRFGLSRLGDRYPAELSGGELQRLALARSLSWNPRLMILDEALGALDVATRADVLASLRMMFAEDGTTVILITHSIADALELGDRSVVLGGRPARIVTDFGTRPPRPEASVRNRLWEAIRDGHL